MALRQITEETEDTQTELATTRNRVRDEDQREIDLMVTELVNAYDASGQPDNGIPNKRFAYADKTDAKRRVNRAFSLVSKDRTPKLGARWFKDSKPDADGWVTVKFGVRQVAANENGESAESAEGTEGTEEHGRRGRR
jgi:hypothetical protein